MIESYANYEWFLKNDFGAYAGKWLVILDEKIVAVGKDVTKIIKEVNEKYPNQKPFITKVKNTLSIL